MNIFSLNKNAIKWYLLLKFIMHWIQDYGSSNLILKDLKNIKFFKFFISFLVSLGYIMV